MTHNVVYLFSIYRGEVITPNLGNYQADMTISPTAKCNECNVIPVTHPHLCT